MRVTVIDRSRRKPFLADLRYVPATILMTNKELRDMVLQMLESDSLADISEFIGRLRRIPESLTEAELAILERWRLIISEDGSPAGLVLLAPYAGYLAIYTAESALRRYQLLEESCRVTGLTELTRNGWKVRRGFGDIALEQVSVGTGRYQESSLSASDVDAQIDQFPDHLGKALARPVWVAADGRRWTYPESAWVIHDVYGPGWIPSLRSAALPADGGVRVVFSRDGVCRSVPWTELRHLLSSREVSRRLAGPMHRSAETLRRKIDRQVAYDHITGKSLLFDEGRLSKVEGRPSEIETDLSSPDLTWVSDVRKIHPRFGLGKLARSPVSLVRRGRRYMRFPDGGIRVVRTAELRGTLSLREMSRASGIPGETIFHILELNGLRPAYYRRGHGNQLSEWDQAVLPLLPGLHAHKKGQPHRARPDLTAMADIWMIPVQDPPGVPLQADGDRRHSWRLVIHDQYGPGVIKNASVLIRKYAPRAPAIQAAGVYFPRDGSTRTVPWTELRKILAFEALLRAVQNGKPFPSWKTLRKALDDGLFSSVPQDALDPAENIDGFDEAIVPSVQMLFSADAAPALPVGTRVIHAQWGEGTVERTGAIGQDSEPSVNVRFNGRTDLTLVPVRELKRFYYSLEAAQTLAKALKISTKKSVEALQRKIQRWIPYDARVNGEYLYHENQMTDMLRLLQAPEAPPWAVRRKIHPELGPQILPRQSRQDVEQGLIRLAAEEDGKSVVVHMSELREALSINGLMEQMGAPSNRRTQDNVLLRTLLAINGIFPVFIEGAGRGLIQDYDSNLVPLARELFDAHDPGQSPAPRPEIVARHCFFMLESPQRGARIIRRGA